MGVGDEWSHLGFLEVHGPVGNVVLEADGLHLTLWGHGELDWGFEVLEELLGNGAVLNLFAFLETVGHHLEVFGLQVVLVLSLSGEFNFVFKLESSMLVNTKSRQRMALHLVSISLANVPSWLLALLVGHNGPNDGQYADDYLHCSCTAETVVTGRLGFGERILVN